MLSNTLLDSPVTDRVKIKTIFVLFVFPLAFKAHLRAAGHRHT